MLLTPPAGAADEPDQIAAAVEAAVRPVMARHEVPGMAVAVTVDGRSRVFAYGVASKASGAPVTGDTLFEIGSISKTFAATLGTYAEALGRLSLDDHPGKHLPEFDGAPIDAATLSEFGTYTAGGLPLQFPDGVGTDADAIAYLRAFRPSAAPGATRRYSNPSIGVFGRAAARAMGGDFAEVAETRLFPALGLTSTFLRIPAADQARYAFGYGKANAPVRVSPGAFADEAYGVKTSARDMIRFVELNMAPDALDAPLRRAVEATHLGRYRVGPMTQGLGWEQYPYPVSRDDLLAGNSPGMIVETQPAARIDPPAAPSGPTLFNKTGSTNGFGAYAAFVPEKRIGIVILANRSFPIPDRVEVAHAVMERLAAGR